MKLNDLLLSLGTIATNIIGITALVFIVMVLAGKKVPYISGDRQAFIALVVIGITMCAFGIAGRTTTFGWTNPINIFAIMLGVIATMVAFFVLTGKQLPLIANEKQAFMVIAIVIVAKWGLGILQSHLFK